MKTFGWEMGKKKIEMRFQSQVGKLFSKAQQSR